MNEIMMFKGNEVEVFEFEGKVLFNPKHVAKILELGDSSVRMAIAKMSERQVVKLTNSDVKDIDIRKLNNAGENFLTESGVYKLIMRSNKPEAEEFQDWVTDEVLPQIRETGGYIPVSKDDDEADIMAKALLIAHKTIERKNAVIEYQKPLVELAENRIDKKGCFSITDATKSLNLKRGNITRWAKEEGYLHKTIQEVNKAGEKYFKVYSSDGKHNQIGVTEEGLMLIKEHIREVSLS